MIGKQDNLRIGGIVLCGGKSTRMGQPKMSLKFGNEILLQRIVRLLGQAVSPIVVVASDEQELPDLEIVSNRVIVARDEVPDLGPLQGILTGLKAISEFAEAAYVTSCDVPFLNLGFVEKLANQLGDHGCAVPFDEKHVHPLSAIYRTSNIHEISELLANNRRRPIFLYDQVRTIKVHVDELRDVDPNLDTLQNLNTPEEYAAAIARIES